jgi:hypothetical protein
MTTVFCEMCGREADAAAKFCGYCGARILPEAGNSSPPTSAPAQRSAPDAELAGIDRIAAGVGGKLPKAVSSVPGTSALAQSVAPDTGVAGIDRIAARVGGKLPEAGPSFTRRASSSFSSNGNDLGGYVKWAYVGGMVLIAFGVRLAFFVTRFSTNLLTGQTSTSYPDLGIGIVLVVIGIFIAGAARLTDKGWPHW